MVGEVRHNLTTVDVGADWEGTLPGDDHVVLNRVDLPRRLVGGCYRRNREREENRRRGSRAQRAFALLIRGSRSASLPATVGRCQALILARKCPHGAYPGTQEHLV